MKILYLLLLSMVGLGANSQCPNFFIDGKAPSSKTIEIKEICFDYYTVGYSEKYQNPVYTASYLNKSIVQKAREIPRKNAFHQEPIDIKQAKLYAYKHSGYDRGHMVPDADMPTYNASYQSFSILNMVPQNPHNNRQAWTAMEAMARNYAFEGHDVYVISGPIFKDNTKKLKDGTVVPTAFFKIIYIKNKPIPKCLYIKNAANQKYILKSITECEQLTDLVFYNK